MKDILDISKETINFLKENDLLKLYIEKRLIYKYANKLDYSDAKEKAIKDKFYKDNNLESPKKVAEYIINQDFLDQEELNQKLLIQSKLAEYAIQNFEDTSKSFFYDNKAYLDKYFFSILRLSDYDMALELYFRIDSNESDFSKIARLYSEGYEKDTGGFIGPSNLASLHPLLKEKLKSISVGQLTEPFKLENFWIILRLEKLVPAKFDLTTKKQICMDLFNQYIKKETIVIFKRLLNTKN